MKQVFILLFLFSVASFFAQNEFKTKYVVIAVMDGARYQETFGDSSRRNIPNLDRMKADGVLMTNFYNNGPTYTNASHAAILTGHYKMISNTGKQLPKRPNIFQYYQKSHKIDKLKTWIVSSKGKLEMLANAKDKKWWNRYMPMTYCGVKGQSVEYEGDRKNFEQVKKVIDLHHPELMLINFLEADARGHNNNWQGYINGIKNIDLLCGQLWDYIQSDSLMANNTTLFITNDHGRHDDGRKEGFKEHGDKCNGCKHIFLMAFGPDFKKNEILDQPSELIDISKTIAHLLNFSIPTSNGRVLHELFKTTNGSNF